MDLTATATAASTPLARLPTARLPSWLGELAADLAALVWQVECVGCGLPDRACCTPCLAELRRVALEATLDPVATPGTPSEHLPPHFAAGQHDGALRELLVPFKHVGRTSLAPTLGKVLAIPLARALACARGPDPPLIVPIPSRRQRVRERGFHHVEVLGRAAMRELRAGAGAGSGSGVGGGATASQRPSLLRALKPLPGRTSQVGLRIGQRRQNAARIFVPMRARRRLELREVILLDDVRTTGETLRAAAGTLARSGAMVVATVTLTQARRHAPQKSS